MPPFPEHLKESASASPEYSSGVVLDSETLLREMFNPQHIIDGKVMVTAVSLTELRSTGFSVHRKEHVSFNVVQESIEKRLRRPRKGQPWKDEGVAEILTRDVRDIREDGERLFAVIDTALPDNRGHASIYAANPTLGDAHARKLRLLLIPLLENRKPLEQAFEENDHGGDDVNGDGEGVRNRMVGVLEAASLSRILRHICQVLYCCWRPNAKDKDQERGGH